MTSARLYVATQRASLMCQNGTPTVPHLAHFLIWRAKQPRMWHTFTTKNGTAACHSGTQLIFFIGFFESCSCLLTLCLIKVFDAATIVAKCVVIRTMKLINPNSFLSSHILSWKTFYIFFEE